MCTSAYALWCYEGVSKTLQCRNKNSSYNESWLRSSTETAERSPVWLLALRAWPIPPAAAVYGVCLCWNSSSSSILTCCSLTAKNPLLLLQHRNTTISTTTTTIHIRRTRREMSTDTTTTTVLVLGSSLGLSTAVEYIVFWILSLLGYFTYGTG